MLRPLTRICPVDGGLLAEEELQERRLAGAGGSRQEDELSALDRARDVASGRGGKRPYSLETWKSWITRRVQGPSSAPRATAPGSARPAGLLHDLSDEPAEGLGLCPSGRARPATGLPTTICRDERSSSPASLRSCRGPCSTMSFAPSSGESSIAAKTSLAEAAEIARSSSSRRSPASRAGDDRKGERVLRTRSSAPSSSAGPRP